MGLCAARASLAGSTQNPELLFVRVPTTADHPAGRDVGNTILAGRYHVDFADIRALAYPVLRHRLVLNFHARADGVDADALIERLLKTVSPEE